MLVSLHVLAAFSARRISQNRWSKEEVVELFHCKGSKCLLEVGEVEVCTEIIVNTKLNFLAGCKS